MNSDGQAVSVKTYFNIIIATVIVASLGKLFDFPDVPYSTVGLELGISFAAVLLFGFKPIPAIFVGVLISQLFFPSTILMSLGTATACISAAILGRWGMLYFNHFDNNLENRKSVISLLSWGAGVAALFATGLCLLWLNMIDEGGQLSLNIFLHTWMWSAMGVLLIAPPILLLNDFQYVRLKYDQRHMVWLLSITAFCLLVFTDFLVGESLRHVFLPYIFYPLIVWGALYVGLSTVYAGVFLIFMSAYTSYLFGVGFYGGMLSGTAIQMWSFITSLSITGLAVGVSQVQREQAEWKAASSRMDELLSRTSLSLKSLLTMQCNSAVNGVKGCYSAIFLMDDANKFTLAAQHDLPETFTKAFDSADFNQLNAPITECFKLGKQVSSVENPKKWVHLDAPVALWGGVHCFPILNLFRKPLGVLCVFYSSSTRFQLAEIGSLQRIAYQCSLLIVRKQAEIALNDKHREVENERAILRTMIDANPDVIFIKDQDRKLTHSNSAFKKLIGLSEQQALGLSSDEVFSERLDPLIAEMDWKILTNELEVVREEVWLKNFNGVSVLFDLVKAPMKNIEGKILGVISIGRDITQQREVEAELVAMTEDQQRVIGQELHDGVGQKLVGISFLAKLLDHGLHAKNSEFAKNASTLAIQINEVIAEVRGLARGLLPIELESNGLNAALESLSATISNTFKIECIYVPIGEVLVRDRIVSLNLYRIVQEAVNNAIRHGKASSIEIRLEVSNTNFILSIKDDGIGFDYEKYSQHNKVNGIGLQSMVYRARLINAKVNFTKLSDEGFEITVVN